jgi:hypothetical protein
MTENVSVTECCLLAAGLSLGVLFTCGTATAESWPADLNPVRFRTSPEHAPVVLVAAGEPRASIVVGANAAGAENLQKYIEIATGAKLPITRDLNATPAIVLGDHPLAAEMGLTGAGLPPEGFVIRTAADRVFIVGNSAGKSANGVAWGVSEFLERFLDMRWYFPKPEEGNPQDLGQDIPHRTDLVISPVWLEDEPAFRKREMWPPVGSPWNGSGTPLAPVQSFLRVGNSWPNTLIVHAPQGKALAQLAERYGQEILQVRMDGTRDPALLSYAAPETLAMYLDQMDRSFNHGEKSPMILGKTVTVSPGDVELADYHPRARELWQTGVQFGGASRVMADFVQRLALAAKERFPQATIVYLPYLNYTAAPEGYRFPGNVEVQLCGMPGLASYKEESIRKAEQDNIDRWIAISGRPIQNWHYNVWPAHRTKAAYQYPHVIQRHYRDNRGKTAGTFINGDFDHWPRQHISLYCWLKLLWNPDFNVDAAVDGFCKRMFGPAAATMRELVGMQMQGWEDREWPGGRFSPRGIYEVSFPRADVERMEALWAKARKEAAGDALTLRRLDYYEGALLDFFKESKNLTAGGGFQTLLVQRVGELPAVDGRLDDPQWERTEPVSFVQSTGPAQGQPAKYPTLLRAVWSAEGMVLGFHMTEPYPGKINTENGGRDSGNLWWDDNVEIFLDVTGKNEGEYYQLIMNAKNEVFDSLLKDVAFNWEGVKGASHVGADFWSMEIYVPYSAFKDAVVPGPAKHVQWYGNFTRHRVADSRQKGVTPAEGSTREYQRMNTTGSVTSDNLSDFGAVRFVE